MTLLITGGLIVDPAQNLEEPRDLLIENGKIAALKRPGAIPKKAAGSSTPKVWWSRPA